VILTVNPLASLYFLTDSELHLATETEQDRTKLSLLQYLAHVCESEFIFAIQLILMMFKKNFTFSAVPLMS
jgi:hypothetical protein